MLIMLIRWGVHGSDDGGYFFVLFLHDDGCKRKRIELLRGEGIVVEGRRREEKGSTGLKMWSRVQPNLSPLPSPLLFPLPFYGPLFCSK
jgi:hypothetical protein